MIINIDALLRNALDGGYYYHYYNYRQGVNPCLYNTVYIYKYFAYILSENTPLLQLICIIHVKTVRKM